MSGWIKINCDKINTQLDEIAACFGEAWLKKYRTAAKKALREAMNAGWETAASIAASEYFGPQGKVHREIAIRQNPYTMAVDLTLSGRRGVSLMNFRPDPKTPKAPRPAQGVSVHVRRGGARHAWRDERNPGFKTFIGSKNNGGYAVFINRGLKKKVMGPGRRKASVVVQRVNDLVFQYGPSPIQALQRQDRQELVRATIEAAFLPSLRLHVDEMLAEEAARLGK